MKTTLESRYKKLVKQLALVSAQMSDAHEEAIHLRHAIEKHRRQSGQNLCWMNDVELWQVLGDGKSAYPFKDRPTKEEFLMGCQVYIASRFKKPTKKKK